MSRMNQSQVQGMLQKLSPQQIQMIRLLELPTIQLEQCIKKEIYENPALEENIDESNEYETSKELSIEEYKRREEIPSYKLQISNYSKDDKIYQTQLSDSYTLTEYLKEQLSYLSLSEEQYEIAEYIVGSLDSNGYLRRDISSITDDLAFNIGLDVEESKVVEALKYVQMLEPRGVGARDLQETLILQLKSQPVTPITTLAIEVLTNFFNEFTRKHYEKIVTKLNLDEDTFRSIIAAITNLSPKPANLYAEQIQSEPTIQITPDFTVENVEGELELTLNKGNKFDIQISKHYLELLANMVKESKIVEDNNKKTIKSKKEAASFIRQKIDSAKWFISALKQRNATLLLTINYIVDFQKKYFLSGSDSDLKPMILKDIADLTGLDLSTISRVVNSKYIETDFGVFSLKYFFSEAMMTSDGEEVSSREIKSAILEYVENEDKNSPLTDEVLMDTLQEKGYQIARRTVAKYREMLNIPVARLRKEF